MILEYFKIALRSLTRRKTRSWLTMIGIFIGIAAVVSLISLGQGMQDSIQESFESIGTDKLFISPGSSLFSIGENIGTEPITEDDVRFLIGQGGVKYVTYYAMTSAKVEYQDVVRYYLIAGIPTNNKDIELMEALLGVGMAKGRMLSAGDRTATAIAFYHNERGLYDGENMNVNSKFLINDQKFYVAGVFEPIGSSQDDKMIYLPIDSFRDVTGIEERVDYVIVQVAEGKDPAIIGDELKRSLARFRGVKEGDEDFTIQTPEELLASFQTILDIVKAVLIGIALISLFVGSVGIMNTMYTSVLERNKEIGIMKAIGARNKDIFWLFFIESGILGLVGGAIGIIIGTGLASAVELVSTQALGKSFLQANYSWELFVGALVFSFIVGALAGTLPAIQASKEKPADTLRDE